MLKRVVREKTAILPTLAVKSKTIKTTKQAFTLLELVIVVLIMGLLYGMVSLSLNKATTTLPTLSVLNIADFLQAQTDTKERTFYLYGNQCNKVQFKPDLDEDVEIDEIRFTQNSTAFWFDSYGVMQALRFAPIKDEYFTSPVCLRFKNFANRSHTPMVIQSGETFYYHSFFDGLKSFSSLDEAATWIKHTRINPRNLGLLR